VVQAVPNITVAASWRSTKGGWISEPTAVNIPPGTSPRSVPLHPSH
jgi:hypothetical protein